MRKASLIIAVVLLILSGCKPKSKSSLEIKTNDSTKSNNGLKMPDVGDFKNNSNNTYNSNWSKEYRDKFLQGCISKASEKVSAADAFSYCNCMAQKVEAKYPVETEVDNKLSEADIESMRAGCLPSTSNQTSPSNNQSNNNTYNNSRGWSASDQREFMDNCTPGASKSLGTSAATDYCSCMMQKLMVEYPDSKDAGNATKSHMSELAADCLKR